MQNKQQFRGTDASLEISLLEYGLIVSTEPHKDGSGSYFCVYRQGDGFGCGHVYPKDIDNLLNGKEWADEKDLRGFLDTHDFADMDQYIGQDFVRKLADLIGYWGAENVIGTDYDPMTEEEVKFRYLYVSKDNVLE